MGRLGEHTLTVDCDCLVADGGTRTAAITGAFVALTDAVRWLQAERGEQDAITDHVAAVSVGMLDGVPCLDLSYEEDSTADVDMNVVMTGAGSFVEVQGTAEHAAFDKAALDEMLALAQAGIAQLIDVQRAVLDQ
jgi:ribonuclease PH